MDAACKVKCLDRRHRRQAHEICMTGKDVTTALLLGVMALGQVVKRGRGEGRMFCTLIVLKKR